MHDLLWKSNVTMQAGQAQKDETWYEALLSGRWATAVGGSWQLKEGGKQSGVDAPLLLSNSWDLAVVPKGLKDRASIATIDGWVIWKGSPYVAEAWELMKFLETDAW
ncbi:MAG: extracellular solute-binding protein [Chloroflexi bacterium]|nr:extracellular solute-binding protein [Chloroflexota bacterium]